MNRCIIRGKKATSVLSIVFVIVLLFSSCSNNQAEPVSVVSPSTKNANEVTASKLSDQEAFNRLTDELFQKVATTSTLDLNYIVERPENYGIKVKEQTLGNYSLKEMKQRIVEEKEYQKRLKQINPNKLVKEDQITYDILQATFELSSDLEQVILYQEPLTPALGIQAQLPILLQEYHLNKQEDVEHYLELLEDIPRYFKQILSFEEEKAKEGLFMSDASVDAVVEQCNSFIKEGENHFLVVTFAQRLQELDLPEEKIVEYIEQNKKKIKKVVIPAYQKLIEGITKLKGKGKNKQGISHFPKGKEYYEYIAKSAIGSEKTVDQYKALIQSTMLAASMSVLPIIKKNPEIEQEIKTLEYPIAEPNEIIRAIQEKMKEEYPVIKEVKHQVKYVDSSLEEHLAPAMYLTPQIDHEQENVIYINNGAKDKVTSMFTTIAHESYPGHLYQTNYFRENNKSNLRKIINYAGYMDGWATYVENNSAKYTGLKEDYVKVLEASSKVNLCLTALIDIGINYEGWSFDTAKEQLAIYGIVDEKTVNQVYQQCVQEVGNPLQYICSYIEIATMREKAENTLNDRFKAIDFNKCILDIGPAPFSVVEKYFEQWLNEQEKNVATKR